MTLFARFLAGAFSGLFGFFARFITRRFAVMLAVSTMFLSMVVATWSVLKGMLSGLEVFISDSNLLLGMYSLLPSNFEGVLAVYFSARLVVWAYHLNTELLNKYMAGA